MQRTLHSRNPLGPQPGNLRFVLWDPREKNPGLPAPHHVRTESPSVGQRAVCACAPHLRPPALLPWQRPAWRARLRETQTSGRRAQAPGRRRRGSPAPFPARRAVGPAPCAGPAPEQDQAPAGSAGTLGLRAGGSLGPGLRGNRWRPRRGWMGSAAPGRAGLTFGKRQRRSGPGCWGRSFEGCPGDCYLWQKDGGSSSLQVGGRPAGLPGPSCRWGPTHGGAGHALLETPPFGHAHALETPSFGPAHPSFWPRPRPTSQ